MVAKKWQVTEISGKGMDIVSDSIRQKMYKEATIEFKSDGKFETRGMGDTPKTGTWQLTGDEKSLVTIEDGSKVTDTVNIVEVVAGKLVVEDPKVQIRINLKSQ